MRINTPVTNVEYQLTADQYIVSTTDLKGKITYVNPTFVEVSEFSTEEELIGKAQNIVRHPDMPAAAFADLWRTLKAGIPWTGVIKNRRKSGGFYWVLANVTPIKEEGRAVGYMSVRTKPTRAQVERGRRRLPAAARRPASRGARAAPVRPAWPGRLGQLRELPLGPAARHRHGRAGGAAAGAGRRRPGGAGLASARAGPGRRRARRLRRGPGWRAWHALYARLIAPLLQATEVARLAAGDLHTRFGSSRRDETGQLLLRAAADERQPGGDRRRRAGQRRQRSPRHARNRRPATGPVGAHRSAGVEPGADGRQHGADSPPP